jgi:exodeoxyribonuclease VII large subunit
MRMIEPPERPAGIPGSTLTGPWPVGQYAAALRGQLRAFTRVQVFGEVFSFKVGRAKVWFELRDGSGALPCSMWKGDFDALGLSPLADGVQVVAAGGCDFYPGSRTASPAFSFDVTRLRIAGEGDLLAQLERLRRALHAEGLFDRQKALHRPLLPRTIGVVTAEAGAARRDLLAGLRRRGWGGTVVWAFAPVQDRHAAPAIAAAIQGLAARPEIEAIVVTRGGGSLADLWAFCDETLCRTVAMLRVPVVSAIGHERDSTLIDDVAAVACSTPTHAAEAAVPLDCGAARQGLRRCAAALRRAGEGAIGARARHLAALARGPARALQRERSGLNQKIREIRAASERGLAERSGYQRRIASVVLDRARRRGIERTAAALAVESRRGAAIERSAARSLARRREALRKAAVALRAHDPERTLERGYALAETEAGDSVTTAAGAVAAAAVRLRFADGRVQARIEGDVEREAG